MLPVGRVEARDSGDDDVLAELGDELEALLLEALDRVDPSACTARSTRSAKPWNSSLFETGSVSQPMPSIVPSWPSTM